MTNDQKASLLDWLARNIEDVTAWRYTHRSTIDDDPYYNLSFVNGKKKQGYNFIELIREAQEEYSND
jgi:hypothetical protein